ncbi:MAG: DsrE family protein [Parvularculaceae bacterium]
MKLAAVILALLAAGPAFADETAFTKGPVFEEFGPVADVDADFAIPKGASLKTSFDVNKAAEPGALNRTLESAARFINMHARAGVPLKKMKLAVVVHGSAVNDVSNAAQYAEGIGGDNANAPLVAALIGQGVRIIVCGQSAAYYGVEREELLPGVEMALSAMTAHAVLQGEGYAINPF